ncbi:MAG: cache domain-containing protein, partial [Syntrophomonas sp.]
MDKKRSIRQKMITVILSLSLISLFLMSILVVFSMTNMRNSINSTSGALGQSAADDSQAALEKQAIAQLTATAQNKARISDEKLAKLQKYVQLMSMQATDIYSNPSRYVSADVKPPSSSNKGKITPQLLYAEGSDRAAMTGEIARAANIDNLLKTIPENDADVFSTYIGTESGFVIKVDKDSDDQLKILDPRQRGWYKLARENNSLVWTDVFDDAMGRGLAITCAMPFYDARGNIKGVVGIGSLLTTLNEIIIETKIGESGYALVLNEKGDMIISPTVQRVEGKIVRENFLTSDNASLKAAAQRMVARQSGVERFVYNGKEVLFAYEPLQNLPWSIATVMEVNEAIAPALQSKTNIMALASGAVDKVDRDILTVIVLFVVVSIASVLLVVFFSLLLSRR